MGVGHIGALPELAGRDGQQQDNDVCGHSCGLCIHSFLVSCCSDQRTIFYEQTSDRLCKRDAARGKHGAGDIHVGCEAFADRVRAVDMGVGHVREMQDGPWAGRQHASDADRRTISGQRDAIRIDGDQRDERSEKIESRRDRVEQRDNARGEPGAGVAHRFHEVGDDDVRADGVGVRYIAAVPAWAQHDGQPARVGHDGAAGRRERDAGLLCGAEHGERVEAEQPGGDGVVERNGARVGPRADDVHGLDEGGQDGVRADDVGGRHVHAMPGGARRDGKPAGGDKRWGEVRERERGTVFGGGHGERHAEGQQRGHGVDQRDGARSQHGSGDVHCVWRCWADAMRAVDVGVGHIGALPELAGRDGQPQAELERWWTGHERDIFAVGRHSGGQRRIAHESCCDWLSQHNSAGDWHGSDHVHRVCQDRAHGVRADDVGGGHFGAVSICARGHGKPIGGSDKRGASRKHDEELFGLAGGTECDTSNERSCDGRDQRDRAWCQHGSGLFHSHDAGIADSVRTNDVELGHVSQKPDWARRGGKSGAAADGRDTCREHDIELLDRRAKDEHDTASERGCDRLEQCDPARDKRGLDRL